MRVCVWLTLVVAGMAATSALGQEGRWAAPGAVSYGLPGQAQAADLTIEQQRKLGLTDEQILKIAEQRRDLEKERAKVEAQFKAAQEAAAAANAEVARLNQQLYADFGAKLTRIYEAAMTEPQRKAWNAKRYADQARQWLQNYKQWLKLTDAQMDDLSALLVPVYEKCEKMEQGVADTRDRLAALRKAEKPDVAAIEKAEKELAEASQQNIWQLRQNELMDKMRPGLLPDQIEKLDRIQHRQK